MNTNHDKDLEQLIHRTLRSLPERRAPRTLEHRVLSAIAAQAALPWYRRSFTSWPLAVRTGFLALSLGVAYTVAQLGNLGTAPVREGLATASARLDPFARLGSALLSSLETLVHAIPSLWLYGGLATIAFAYLSLFGLGATAYRSFVANR